MLISSDVSDQCRFCAPLVRVKDVIIETDVFDVTADCSHGVAASCSYSLAP